MLEANSSAKSVLTLSKAKVKAATSVEVSAAAKLVWSAVTSAASAVNADSRPESGQIYF